MCTDWLKEAPLSWNITFSAYLFELDFRRCEYDIKTAVKAILESEFPNSYGEQLIIAK